MAIEYPAVEAYGGQSADALDPVFEQLVRNLSPGQRPILRIGGDSTDWTWWPVPGMSRPPGVTYSLTRRWLDVTRALSFALHARLILGINLEANSRRLASAEAKTMLAGLGGNAIEAFEIGNEPELYGSYPWVRAPGRRATAGRPRGYDFSAFLREYVDIARSLPPAVQLAGPSIGSAEWLQHLGLFLTDERGVRLVTIHRYALKHCQPSHHITIDELLSDATARGLASQVAPYVTIARRYHLPLRVEEMNAVSCGGERGVSNTFAAALWALDTLFELVRAGADGVNIHTDPRSISQLFAPRLVNGFWSAYVRPEYYGLMMFAQAAPPGSRLMRVSGLSRRGLHTWAVRTPDGNIHVVLINERPGQPSTIKLRLASNPGPGTLELMRAPRVNATSGVTLGGQTFGSETTTGLLADDLKAPLIRPVHGYYTIALPATSAAMLDIQTQ